MKRTLIALLAAALMAPAAMAQIVSSRSSQVVTIRQPKQKKPKVKHPLQPITYISADIDGNSIVGIKAKSYTEKSIYKEGEKTKVGFQLLVGHQFPMGKSRFFYAVEGGLSTIGYKMDYSHTYWNQVWTGSRYSSIEENVNYNWTHTAYCLQVSPLTLGWKPRLSDKMAFEMSLGLNLSYALFGSLSGDSVADDASWDDDISKFGVGLNYNFGFWYEHVYVGLRLHPLNTNFLDSSITAQPMAAGLNLRYAF